MPPEPTLPRFFVSEELCVLARPVSLISGFLDFRFPEDAPSPQI